MKIITFVLLALASTLIISGCGFSYETAYDDISSYIDASSMTIDRKDNIYVTGRSKFSPGGGGIFRSTDDGENWEQLFPYNDRAQEPIFAFVQAGSDGLIYTGYGKGISRSSDMGQNWMNIDSKYAHNISSILIVSDSMIIAGSYGNGVLVSTKWGDNWELSSLKNLYIYCLLNCNGYIFAGGEHGMIFRSEDNTKTWTPLKINQADKSVTDIIADPNGNIFAAVNGNDLYRSEDNGETWSKLNISDEVRSIAADSNGNIFIATFTDGTFKWDGNSESCAEINSGLGDVTAIAVNSKGYVFAGTSNQGVFRSLNNGKSWSPANHVANIPEPLKKRQAAALIGDSIRGGFQILPRENEIELGFGMEMTLGLYRMILPALSTVVVYKDPNYKNKTNASYTSFFTLGALLLAGSMHYEDVGKTKDIIQYILIVPIIIANSEHHLMIMQSGANNPFETSFYLTSRTDIFNTWWRYTAGGGIQIGLNSGGKDNPYNGSVFGLQIGYEKALLGDGLYDRNWKFFGGLRYFFN